MIEKLNRIVDDVSDINSKLVLLIGPPKSGKSNLLGQLAGCRDVRVLPYSPSKSLILLS